jgi:hypothetical protein
MVSKGSTRNGFLKISVIRISISKKKNMSFFLTFKSMSDQKIKMNALFNQQNISSKRAENYERVRDDGCHRRLHTFDPQKLLLCMRSGAVLWKFWVKAIF